MNAFVLWVQVSPGQEWDGLITSEAEGSSDVLINDLEVSTSVCKKQNVLVHQNRLQLCLSNKVKLHKVSVVIWLTTGDFVVQVLTTLLEELEEEDA